MEKNARLDSGESVFNRRNVENTTLRSVADRGVWDVEIYKFGKKAVAPGVGWHGAPAAVSDMNDAELNFHTREKAQRGTNSEGVTLE